MFFTYFSTSLVTNLFTFIFSACLLDIHFGNIINENMKVNLIEIIKKQRNQNLGETKEEKKENVINEESKTEMTHLPNYRKKEKLEEAEKERRRKERK